MEAIAFLAKRLTRKCNVVELGSGAGTPLIADMCERLYSIEHDAAWIGMYPFDTNYIPAPIVDGWYDPEVIARCMPKEYDCIVVDGPPGRIGRGGFLDNLDLFEDVPMLFDDTHRQTERDLAIAVAMRRDLNISLHYTKEHRGFATVGFSV